jgi:hypothetical protein
MTVTLVPPMLSVTPSSKLHETWTGGGEISVPCPWKGGSSERGCSVRERTVQKGKQNHLVHSFPLVTKSENNLGFPIHLVGKISRYPGII